jgi:hypothetical protein
MQLTIFHDVTDDDANGARPPFNGFWAVVGHGCGRTLWRKISLTNENHASAAPRARRGYGDPRRYRVIEVRRVNARTWHLTIDGEMWGEVEWSHDRQAWCIQDAAGHCLAHVEHIVGQNVDAETAIRLAKGMIVDGRMPSPEEAERRRRERWEPNS